MLDNESTTTAESTETTAPEVTHTESTPAEPTETGVELSGNENVDGDGTETPPTEVAKPAYVPKLKFKVYDQEKEMDPVFKDLIKDEETEKKLAQLYSKAEATEVFLPKFKEVKKQYDNLNGYVSKAVQYRNSGDLDSFFEHIEVPDDILFKHVLKKLEQRDWTPEQRMMYQQNRDNQKRALTLQEQNQQIQSSVTDERAQFMTRELGYYMQRPDVTPIAQKFDQKFGEGAFYKEVVLRGQMHSRNGNEITVEQAVQEALRLAKPFAELTQQATQGQPGATQVSANGVVLNQGNQAPTIPNVQSRGTSPAKKAFRSISDLKAKAKEFEI